MHRDLQVSQALDRLDLDVGGALDAPKQIGDPSADVGEGRQIVTEDLDRDLRLDAGQQFVDPHLDRLRVAELDAGNVLEFLTQGGDQFGLVFHRGPLVPGPENDVHVALPHPHGIRGDVRASRSRHDADDLGQFHDRRLDPPHGIQCLRQGHRGNLERLDDDRPLVHRRQELRSQRRHDQRRGDEENDGADRDDLGVFEDPPQLGQVDLPDQVGRVRDSPPTEDRRRLEQQRGQRRNQRQAQDQGGAQGDRDRVGQGCEHLAFHAAQRGDRQEDDDDDEDAEDDRPGDLEGGLPDHRTAVEAFPVHIALPRHQAHGVLDEDDGPVSQHADGDRQPRQGHQIGRQADHSHDQEGRQRRHRQLDDDEEGRTDVSHEKQQHEDDHDGALEESALNRTQGGFHQLRTVVEGGDRHIVRQRPLCNLELVLEACDDVLARCAPKHQYDAGDGLALAVAGDRTLPDLGTDDDRGDLTEEDGNTVPVRDDGVSKVLEIADPPVAPDDVLLASPLDV